MSTDPTFTMDHAAIAIHTMGEEPSERDYWLTRPVEERLAAVESLRAQHHDWTDDTRPELPRLLRVTRRE